MKWLDGNITVLCMLAWFTLSRTPQICPVVLLLDGHGSHIDSYVVQFCVDNLLLFRLPPYSSHAVQPADSFLDRSNQTLVKKLYISFSVQYPQLSITKRTFPLIFTTAFDKTCCPDVVKWSFRVSGIWLICRENVDHSLFNPSRIMMPLLTWR